MNNLLRALLITNNLNYEFILITDDIQSLYRKTADPVYLLIFYKKHLLISMSFDHDFSLKELFSINKNIWIWAVTRSRTRYFTVKGTNYLRLNKIIISNIKYVYKTSGFYIIKFALCKLKLDTPFIGRILRQNIAYPSNSYDCIFFCITKLSYTNRPDTVL